MQFIYDEKFEKVISCNGVFAPGVCDIDMQAQANDGICAATGNADVTGQHRVTVTLKKLLL